ncbi:MAG: hypothetical protein HWE07_02620 [Cytophagia bacterium]|nr:hypothetical protein [Cytophagia bacterium]
MKRTTQKKRNTNKFKKSIKKKNRTTKSSYLNKGRSIDVIIDNIISKVPSIDSFSKSEYVTLIDSYRNLPEEIVTKIDEYVSQFNIRRGMCYSNSFSLSLNIDDIKICYGWYSDSIYRWYIILKGLELSPLQQKEFQLLVELISQVETGSYVDRYQFINTSLYLRDTYVDMSNGDFYVTHSWNTYNGIHFDLTGEFLKNDLSGLFSPKYRKVNESDIWNDGNLRDILKNVNKKYVTDYLTGSGSMECTIDNTNYHILNYKYKMVS